MASKQTLIQLQVRRAEARRELEEQHKVTLAKVAENTSAIKEFRMAFIIKLLVLADVELIAYMAFAS